tara:strand:- start:4912 stop:5988 length:1077 start_codon:yes stop_codon:yes gene_type:complete
MINNQNKVKYTDFNFLFLIAWDIYSTTISDLVKLASILSFDELNKLYPSAELFILPTCNRFEIYIYSKEGVGTPNRLLNYLIKNYPDTSFIENKVGKRGKDAYIHLVEVTGGLRSIAIGEYQIQGQVKDSYKSAVENKIIGTNLKSIVESVLHIGKKIRSETGISNTSFSLSSLSIDILFEQISISTKYKVLIIGTGKMGTLAAEHFIKCGYSDIMFFSNNPKNRSFVADKFNASIRHIDDFSKMVLNNKIIFSAVSNNRPRVKLDSLKLVHDSVFIIDISIPQYFISYNNKVLKNQVLDMDEIRKNVSKYLLDSNIEIHQCEKIIENEVNSFIQDNIRRSEIDLNTDFRKEIKMINT